MSPRGTVLSVLVVLTACAYSNPSPSGGGGSGNSSGGTGNPSQSSTPPPSSSDDGGAAPVAVDGGPVTILPVPSHGSAIVFSPDDSLAVATNRDVGSVTVLKMSYPSGATPTASVVGEVQVGNQPWQAVISPDSSTAYVVLRQDQQVVEITGLKTTPAVGRTVAVGSEPTGIAMTPTGATVWTANWVDGTLSAISTSTMTIKTTVDLNAPLVQTGYLGTVTPRPALAHPRSLMITNNGNGIDSDESIYATEYFAQVTSPEASNGSNADVHKTGIVYRVQLSNKAVNTITLGALADMGFKDQNGVTAGCYPNQLQAIAESGHFVYVVSVCASPRGPTGPKVTTTTCNTVTDCASLNLVDPVCALPSADSTSSVCIDVASVKTTTAPLISVIDTTASSGAGLEVPNSAVSLNAAFLAYFQTNNVPDDATRRFPLFASDIAFVKGSSVGYVSANGADAVFRMVFSPTLGTLSSVGSSTSNFIDLNPAGIPSANAGLNPVGFATSNTGLKVALASSEVTRVANLLDLNAQAVAGGAANPSVAQLTSVPPAGSDDATILSGKRFFNTGTGRWSLKGQAWGACQACHSDGLTDNVTWYFARGPRQSTSLDGTFNKTNVNDQRILNWTAINDELADFEINTRAISGGVGAIVSADSVPPATGDRIDIATACSTGVSPACTNGNGNAALNGSAAQAADPANPLGLTAPSVLTNWASLTRYVQTIRSPRGATGLDPTLVAAGASLFANDGACIGCHGGPKWTISTVFYSPLPTTNAGLLTKAWSPASLDGFPSALLPATTPANQVMRFGGSNPAAFDQILCVLRPVGTYGVADTGAGIAELRIDMQTPAQGNGDPASNGDGKGYNPPSLLNLVTGAPYFHAGNALTLESLFSATGAGGVPLFSTHYNALAPNFLTQTNPADVQTAISQMVAFLTSIDGTTVALDAPAVSAAGGDFCAFP
ncbi:MAG: YncE family protein [Polyangiaceae bacterium]